MTFFLQKFSFPVPTYIRMCVQNTKQELGRKEGKKVRRKGRRNGGGERGQERREKRKKKREREKERGGGGKKLVILSQYVIV